MPDLRTPTIAAPDHVDSVVIAGLDRLDPAIHPLSQQDGCAGQQRFTRVFDALLPAHDGGGAVPFERDPL